VAFRWRIRRKLMLGLGLVVAIVALLLGGTLKGLLSYRATLKTIDSKRQEVEKAYKVRETIKPLAIRGQPHTTQAEMEARIRVGRQKLQEYKDQLQDTLDRKRDEDHGYREKGQVEALETQFGDLQAAVVAFFNRLPNVEYESGRQDEDVVNDSKVKDQMQLLGNTSADLVDVIIGSVRSRVERAQWDYKVSLISVLSTSVGGVLLLAWLLRFFYHWVFNPVRDLQRGAEWVARGDFGHRIEVHSNDEMEDLAAAFNDMTCRLHEMYCDLARQVNERSRQLVRSERLAGVGFLAAGVAHEINNPLASIAFCSEALEQRLADILTPPRPAEGRPVLAQLQARPAASAEDCETVTKYLKMIQQEAFRCKEITQRLLEFSRGGERRREPTDLGEVIQGVLDVVQHLQSCKGKELKFQPAGRVIAWVNAQEIKSVALNLVVNALDSMDEGGTLTITLRTRDGMAELVFADSGCGMTGEVLENIFEPFFTRSRTGKGTGLGLSISHRIVNQHGGEIEATSPGPGQGSTFMVRLPLKPAEEPKAEGPRQEEADPEIYFQSGRKAA
jgi:signal transduction histidine kinase